MLYKLADYDEHLDYYVPRGVDPFKCKFPLIRIHGVLIDN